MRLRALVLIAFAASLPSLGAAEPFPYRGYYFILSRNPGYGLEDYVKILDCMAEDGCNTLILWIAGGFPSRRYPVTWDYNREHRNVKENFAGKAIDHAHRRGIRVLLGLTPFAYDGVNRYGEVHPELGAVDEKGQPAVTGGIHSLGRGLCPAKAGARDFLLGYTRELFDDFYPNADGFFLEHSDYGTCRCTECAGEKGLRHEWAFVDEISRHVWARKPDATLMIYPQYSAAGIEYDPRYVVFLAPHNLRGAGRVKNSKVLWHGYWDTGMRFRDLCATAAREGYAGVIPSMENFTYENPHAFDTRWGSRGVAGWDDLVVRVSRLSFREHAANPELDDDGFRKAIRERFFDGSAGPGAVADLLEMHRILNRWSGWTWRAGVLKVPEAAVRLDALEPKARETLEKETLSELKALRAIAERSRERAGPSPATPAARTSAEMARICAWVLDAWRAKLPAGALEGGE